MNINTVKNHIPEILTGINVASTIAAVVLTADEAPKAVNIINHASLKQQLTTRDKFSLVWKTLLPAGVCTGVAISTSIAAAVINKNQKNSLLGAALVSDRLLSTFRDKVVDKIGEEPTNELFHQAQREEGVAAATPPKLIPGDLGVYETGTGSELFLDTWSGTLFRASEDFVRLGYIKFEESLNWDIGTFWSANELRDNWCLPQIGAGNCAGWNSMYKPGLNIDWDSEQHIYKIITYDNQPKIELSLPKTGR